MLNERVAHHPSKYLRFLLIRQLVWWKPPLHLLAQYVKFGDRCSFGARAEDLLAVQGDSQTTIVARV